MENAEHVQYLGTFVVSGHIWRGDLFHREDGYWADHSVMHPDGSWDSATCRMQAKDQHEAAADAIAGALAYFERDGADMSVITIIHHGPGMERVARAEIAASAYTH